MPAIVVKAFGGLKPIASAFLLQSGEAVIAENAKLVSGAIKPLKGTSTLKPLTKLAPQTIFRYGNSPSEVEHWLEFVEPVDIINSPIPDDAYARVYWTDGQTPKYAPSTLALSGATYPGGYYNLGVPAPKSAPSALQAGYGKASATITATQISLIQPNDQIKVEVDSNAAAIKYAISSGGSVTAAVLAAAINQVVGVNATVSGSDVLVETESQLATSSLKISRKTGENEDYDITKVTYGDFIGPVTGTTDVAATYTATQSLIESLAPDGRLAVKVNNNAEIIVRVYAGTGTFPERVTPASFKTAVSVAGLDVTVNEGTSQTVTIKTSLTGTTSSFRIRRVYPALTPVFTELVSASNVSSAADQETRSYVYTYVTAYGEEGPPSDPSAVVTIDPNVAITVQNMLTAPGGPYNITKKRIYRTSAVGASSQFQYVDEIPISTTTYSDTKAQSDLGEVLLSTDWDPPPAELKGLKMMANGVAVGFEGNTLWMSEPNLPHAWPHQYPIDYQIVGVAPFRQSVAVLTAGHPFIASGVDPAGMSLERLEFPHACLSKASIVETGDGCLYAGADGIVTIGAGGMKVVTENLFSREQWQSLNPSSMRAFFHDGRYHVMYTDVNNVRGMLIFDVTGQGAVLTTSNINVQSAITAGYSDARTDTLYLAQGGNIVRYNSGTTSLIAKWMSGIYRLIRPVSFSFGMVRAERYPAGFGAIKFRIYADSRTPITIAVNGPGAFRLPAGFTAQQWQFEVESDVEISMFAVATSAAELQGIA